MPYNETAPVVAFALALSLAAGACGGAKTTSSGGPASTAAVQSPTQPSGSSGATTAISVTVNGVSSLSRRGETGRLSAIVTYADGSTQDRTTTARWSSANQGIVTVSAEGVIMAVGDGQTTVTATLGDVSAGKTIRVDLP
jgi:hypothetical protein